MGIVLGRKDKRVFFPNLHVLVHVGFLGEKRSSTMPKQQVPGLVPSKFQPFYLHILVLMAWPARVPQGKWEYSSGCLQSGSSYDGTTLLRPSHSFCFQSLSSHLHVSFQSLLQKCFLMPGKLKWGSTPIYGELGEIHQEISVKKKEVPALLSTVASFQNSLVFFPAGIY